LFATLTTIDKTNNYITQYKKMTRIQIQKINLQQQKYFKTRNKDNNIKYLNTIKKEDSNQLLFL